MCFIDVSITASLTWQRNFNLIIVSTDFSNFSKRGFSRLTTLLFDAFDMDNTSSRDAATSSGTLCPRLLLSLMSVCDAIRVSGASLTAGTRQNELPTSIAAATAGLITRSSAPAALSAAVPTALAPLLKRQGGDMGTSSTNTGSGTSCPHRAHSPLPVLELTRRHDA